MNTVFSVGMLLTCQNHIDHGKKLFFVDYNILLLSSRVIYVRHNKQVCNQT